MINFFKNNHYITLSILSASTTEAFALTHENASTVPGLHRQHRSWTIQEELEILDPARCKRSGNPLEDPYLLEKFLRNP